MGNCHKNLSMVPPCIQPEPPTLMLLKKKPDRVCALGGDRDGEVRRGNTSTPLVSLQFLRVWVTQDFPHSHTIFHHLALLQPAIYFFPSHCLPSPPWVYLLSCCVLQIISFGWVTVPGHSAWDQTEGGRKRKKSAYANLFASLLTVQDWWRPSCTALINTHLS